MNVSVVRGAKRCAAPLADGRTPQRVRLNRSGSDEERGMNDSESDGYQHIVFRDAGVEMDLRRPLVRFGISGSTEIDVEGFPQFCTLTCPLVSDLTDSSGELQPTVVDDVGQLSPLASLIRNSLHRSGCARHGPFPCSCALLTKIGKMIRGVQEEFDLAPCSETIAALCCAPSADQWTTILRCIEDEQWGALTEFYPKDMASTSAWIYSASVQSSSKQLLGFILQPDLPLPLHRRFIGPIPLSQMDTPKTVADALNSPSSGQHFPECTMCRFRGVGLVPCMLCRKFTCQKCLQGCTRCGIQRGLCPRCIVVHTEGEVVETVCQNCLS